MKYFITLLCLLLGTVYTSAQEDTIRLKNGSIIFGKIVLPGSGKICLQQKNNSIKTFSPNDVSMLLFCQKERGCSNTAVCPATPCTEIASPAHGNFQNNTSSINSGEDKGTVIFTCTMCGGEASLELAGGTALTKSSSQYNFTLEKGESSFEQWQYIYPGTYKWKYRDTNNNAAKGTFTITVKETKKIILFEEIN